MKQRFEIALIAATGILLCAGAANGKDWPPASEKECSANHFHINDLISYAESRDQRLPNGSTNYINPGENGSIYLRGRCLQFGADAESRRVRTSVRITEGRSVSAQPKTGSQTHRRSSRRP